MEGQDVEQSCSPNNERDALWWLAEVSNPRDAADKIKLLLRQGANPNRLYHFQPNSYAPLNNPTEWTALMHAEWIARKIWRDNGFSDISVDQIISLLREYTCV